MSNDYRAAWLPFDHGQTDEALARAVDWVEQECERQGRPGVLITPKKAISLYAEPIRQFATRHAWATRRGGLRSGSASGGPVLVHNPGFEDLEYAIHLAGGTSVCATEWPDVPLSGWAAARAALNLHIGSPIPKPADDVQELLGHLHFAGNNGWFDAPGKRDARQLLGELREAAPELSREFIASYMLGMGNISAAAATHLLTLAS